MKTKKETLAYLDALQWQRFSKKELLAELNKFFGVKGHGFEDGTCPDCTDTDYSLLFTTEECDRDNNFIDIEIYYLKCRKRNEILITGTDLLDYYQE